MICAVVAFFSFQFLDGYGLMVRNEGGSVMSKEYRPVAELPVHNGGRTHMALRPEAFLITLDVGGHQGTFEIDRFLFPEVRPGEMAQIRFTKHRFTDNLKILEVSGLGDED
jgi:hypothetical protein